MKRLRRIGMLAFATCFMAPSLVSAQLTSGNYTIDSYIVGEGTFGQSTSSNYTTEFGVDTFIFTEPSTEEISVGTRTGTRVAGNYISTPTATTTEDDFVAPDDTSVTPSDDTVITVEPYVPARPVLSIPSSSVATATPTTSTDVITITPQYTSGERAAAAVDTTTATYYLTLNTGAVVRVQIPAGAFTRPETLAETEVYQVYVLVQADAPKPKQQPHETYNAALAGEHVYTVTAVDSRGAVISRWQKPITITFTTPRNIDLTLGVRAYTFSSTAKAWVHSAKAIVTSRAVTVPFSQSSLFGLWYTPNGRSILYVDTPQVETATTVLDTCPKLFGVCWYWWLLPTPLLYLLIRVLWRWGR